MTRPSRLWEKLGATSPIFIVSAGGDDPFNLNDRTIRSMSINRGQDGPEAGPQDQTLEIATNSLLPVYTGASIRCQITSYGTSLLNSLCGANEATIKPRFYGRIGKQTTDDQSPTKQLTTLYAALWHAQLKNTSFTVNETKGTSISQMIRDLSMPTGVGLPFLPPTTTPSPNGDYGYVAETGEPTDYSTGIDRWATKLNIYGQMLRDGSARYLSVQNRFNNAVNGIATKLPITRSQAISPATWEQPRENMPTTHRVRYIGPDGPTWATFGEDPANPKIKAVEYDILHAKWLVEKQPRSVAWTEYQRDRTMGYRLPSITIDLLYLLTSPINYHRTQAKQLLELECGDPVYFSGDWPASLRGINFVSGMTEHITADRWDIELSLNSSEVTLGEFTPEVPARIWESAPYPWDEDTRKWNQA